MTQLNSQNFYLFTKVERWQKSKLLLFLVMCLSLTLLLLDWSFVRYRLLDESLAPVYWSGQKVITLRWAYSIQLPKSGDFIIYTSSPGVFRAAEVVAASGDQLVYHNNTLWQGSRQLTNILPPVGFDGFQPTVPKNYLWVIDTNARDHPHRATLVNLHSVTGKILGHWQVLIL